MSALAAPLLDLQAAVAQVHHWPWSAEIRSQTEHLELGAKAGEIVFPFYGSSVVTVKEGAEVIMPRRAEKLTRLGHAYASQGESYIICQAPHGFLARSQGGAIELKVRAGGSMRSVSIQPQGACMDFLSSGNAGEVEESELSRTLKSWALFFDDLTEKVDKAKRFRNSLPWKDVADMVQGYGSKQGEPRMALIVKIAESLRRRLEGDVRAARKVLLRERRLLPMSRIDEMDERCLRWYIRQPGRSMAEKGGAKQQLLGMARRESFDTHENRILKDFLVRCHREASRYMRQEVGDNEVLKDSERGRAVKAFKFLCAELKREPIFQGVQRPTPGAPPNYVLLNDHRYRKLYEWYKRLLRREEEKDRYWDWQARAWADISRMLVNLALAESTRKDSKISLGESISCQSPLQAALGVLREQRLGERLACGSEPGPFLLQRPHVQRTQGAQSLTLVDVVHEAEAAKHSIAHVLSQTGGHQYLAAHKLGEATQPPGCLILWGVHTAGAVSPPPAQEIRNAAAEALRQHEVILGARRSGFPQLKGLVLCSSLELAAPQILSNPREPVALVSLPANPERWGDCLAPLAGVLGQLVSEWV